MQRKTENIFQERNNAQVYLWYFIREVEYSRIDCLE